MEISWLHLRGVFGLDRELGLRLYDSVQFGEFVLREFVGFEVFEALVAD
jgi:hypothetical protein